MNRLNKFVKSFLVASLSLAFLMPNAAITSNAAVQVGSQVSKYVDSDGDVYTASSRPTNVLMETGTKDTLFTIGGSGYKVKNIKSSSSNLKIYKRNYSSSNTSNSSYSKATTVNSMYNYITLYGYAKKAGTYTISYNLTDINGVKVMPTQTVTVVAKDDVSPFKKITYAGQSLWTNEGSRFSLSDDTNVYTTKKKGKLIVKPASGYKIKKIEVATYNATATKTTTSDESDDYYTDKYTYETTTNKDNSATYTVDGEEYTINKYDEYNNYIDGQKTYKKVKSGKKITIGTVPRTYSYKTTNTYGYDSDLTTYVRDTDSTDILPATDIRVTYYDKTTKKTFQWSTTIYYVK